MRFIFKKIVIIFLSLIFCSNVSFADNTYFIDFTRVLNESKAGSEAQKKLKDKFESESKKFKLEEEKIRKEESDLISQKKVLSNEDYQKKLNHLRSKVALIQKSQQESLNSIAASRNNARQTLLKSVNPIIKKYMEENKIRIVLDKQSIILGDTTLEITDKIIDILNKEVTSIKVD
ncbi:MAG: OmpH family outer membrane protein [Pelagibacteraceae bacterium]